MDIDNQHVGLDDLTECASHLRLFDQLDEEKKECFTQDSDSKQLIGNTHDKITEILSEKMTWPGQYTVMSIVRQGFIK